MLRLLRVIVGLAASGLLITACIEPIKLQVVPPVEQTTLQHEALCATPDQRVACLVGKTPGHKFKVGAGESLLWARQSPGGTTVVAAVAPKPPEKGRPAKPLFVSFVAFDGTSGGELWRIQLTQKARVEAEEVFFVGEEKIALLTEPGLWFDNTLLMLDARTGRELWRKPSATDKPVEPAHMAIYLPDKHAFLLGSTNIRLVDAETGQSVASRPSLHRGRNARVTGAMPFRSGDDMYLYDYGLVRYSFEKQSFAWGRKFPTFAEDDYTGANIGLAIATTLLGGAPASVPPDYLVGRVTEPVIVGDRILVGALGLVHCIDANSGALLWTQHLEVPQIGSIAVRDGRVYALAGGYYVFWHGRQGMTVRQPIRSGLYCLDLESGEPVAAFQSPFNPNKTAGKMALAQLEGWDEDDAFEDEEDWGDLKQTAPGAAPVPATPKPASGAGFTTTKLIGMAMSDAGLVVASENGVSLLDLNGRELRKLDLPDGVSPVGIVRANDVILVRGTKGIVAIDAATAEPRWGRKVEASSITPARGYVPMIHTLSWRAFRETEVRHFGNQLFWVRGDDVIVASGERLQAVRLADGNLMWELNASGRVELDPESATLTIVDGGFAEMYGLP